ncbi:hypothetical protein CSPX01_03033 [Colletotrichum filicis]|nr:hypothetical protein CSPX01_03033 [Colletotrichum filicis]
MKKPIAKLAVSASNRVIWVDRPNKPQRARGTMCSTADSRDLRIEGRKRKTGLELWWGVANLPTYTPLGVGLGSMDQSMGWDGMENEEECPVSGGICYDLGTLRMSEYLGRC